MVSFRKASRALGLVSFVFLSAPSYAGGVGVGAIGGTAGLGVDLTYGISPDFDIRGTLRGLDYGSDYTENNITYDGTLSLFSTGVIVDWFPGADHGFRLSAGAMYNGNAFSGNATSPNSIYEVGDALYKINGTLGASVDWTEFAPYLGLGWGSAIAPNSNWNVSFDLGVMFTGSPTATLNASGTYQNLDNLSGRTIDLSNPNDPFTQALGRETQQLNDLLNDYNLYPVIQLGVNYRF